MHKRSCYTSLVCSPCECVFTMSKLCKRWNTNQGALLSVMIDGAILISNAQAGAVEDWTFLSFQTWELIVIHSPSSVLFYFPFYIHSAVCLIILFSRPSSRAYGVPGVRWLDLGHTLHRVRHSSLSHHGVVMRQGAWSRQSLHRRAKLQQATLPEPRFRASVKWVCFAVLFLQIVQEYERAVIFRLGRITDRKAKGPGRRVDLLTFTGCPKQSNHKSFVTPPSVCNQASSLSCRAPIPSWK